MLSVLAAASSAPLAPETLFNLGPLPFTNSMAFGLLTAAFVLTLFYFAARASQLWPKSRLAYWSETLIELVLDLVVDSFGDRKKALKFFPLLMSLFVFILAANLSGLLPGVGSVTYNSADGEVSLLRAFTTDLNSTIALAVLSIGTVEIYAIRQLSLRGKISHYFPRPRWNPLNLLIGLNEIFSEILRLVTLSLRLFGVIYGGEALLHAIAELSGNLAPVALLPIMFLEIFVALIQAYLFMMLTTSYLVMAVPADEHKEKAPSGEPVQAKG